MKKPLFSVIIPCYNSEAYLIDALESVVNQTYAEWELIIINDGSFDNTLEIADSYAEKDARVKVFSKENGGYATAVNMGLEHVKGDYFLFLGSDDYLATDLFERLYHEIEKINILPDMIAFRTRLIKKGVIREIEKHTNFDTTLLSKCQIKEFIETKPKYASIFSTRDTSRCYKSDLLGETRYFGTTGMDADGIFSMLISHKACSFFNIPIDGYYWRLRGDSVSATTSLPKTIDRISNWYNFFSILAEFETTEITSTEKSYLMYYCAFVIKLTNNPKNVAKYRKTIIENAKLIKSTAVKLNVQIPDELNYVAKVPLLFSLTSYLRRFIKKKYSNLIDLLTKIFKTSL